ncbi:protein TUNAR-like isoform X1 [Salvelinus fontinalis]|uniref:protein TUNAR-like isoform X1 n=1 Tax=Salvelinus fontinalis TaxID=8038 RepID=UPI002486C59A|nr:protein TUNAR-like isoform X1 [Salvelinus fontinalis]
MSVHYGKAKNHSSMFNAMFLLMLCKTGLKGKLQTFPGKMVNTAICDEERGIQDKEGTEESILAMLGIIGTILNMVVIIFVYIYTTL